MLNKMQAMDILKKPSALEGGSDEVVLMANRRG